MARPNMETAPPVMFAMPIGGCVDIVTGTYIVGTHDQRILLGGLALTTGVVGPPNSFKTTVMRWMLLSYLSRIIRVALDEIYHGTYDTEVNTQEERNFNLTKAFEEFSQMNLFKEGIWQITNRDIYPGNKWWEEVRSYLKEKMKDKGKRLYETAFLDRELKPMKIVCPTSNDIDSISHFMTEDVEAIMDKTELGQSEGNTIYMRQGLAKSRMLLEIPSVAAGHMNFFLFTAHIGSKIEMPKGPGAPPERKQLQPMRQGEVIKGATSNFLYLVHNCWLLDSATPQINQTTKAPEYPYEPGDENAGDNDLFMVKMKQLRGKNGSSGFVIEQFVSQREGVLPYLTEFHFIKTNNRFGLLGSDRNYQLALIPDVSLSRTTVRKKLRESVRLQRAVNIISEIAQIQLFHPLLRKLLVTPEDLYSKLKEKGYDWDWLLFNTRSWNTLDDEAYPGYPLTTLDLCRIVTDNYHPYWLEADCKTIKPEYSKKKVGELHEHWKQ